MPYIWEIGVILICCVTVVDSCSCIEPNSQASYCAPGFAIRGIALSEEFTERNQSTPWWEDYVYYNVKIVEEIKPVPEEYVSMIEGERHVTVTSERSEGVCGTRLPLGTETFITGYLDSYGTRRHLYHLLCSFSKMVHYHTIEDYIQLWRDGYDCDCEIVSWDVNRNSCDRFEAPHTTSICIRNQQGVCHWTNERPPAITTSTARPPTTTSYPGTPSCPCNPPNSYRSYCLSGYAIRGIAINVDDVYSDSPPAGYPFNDVNTIYYTVKIVEEIKSLPAEYVHIRGGERYVTIFTSVHEASCGTRLPMETELFITGATYGQGLLSHMLCDFSKAITHYSTQRDFVQLWRNGYTCDNCQLVFTRGDVTRDSCNGYDAPDLESICSRNQEGVCQWINGN